MRTFLLFICLTSSLIAGAELPEADDFGVGVLIGTMGSVQVKYFATESDAVLLGSEYLDHSWSVFFADYNHHFRSAFKGSKSPILKYTTPYAGVGVGMGFWDRLDTCGRWNCHWSEGTTGTGNSFFVRAIVGIEWFPKGWPASVFAEFTPSYMWYPTPGRSFDAGLGVRYYF